MSDFERSQGAVRQAHSHGTVEKSMCEVFEEQITQDWMENLPHERDSSRSTQKSKSIRTSADLKATIFIPPKIKERGYAGVVFFCVIIV